MKIVLFSDIHANLPALEAFFNEIDLMEYDHIFCLGDLVGYCVWPNEVIAEIKKRGIPTLMGNHDEKVQKIDFDQPDQKNFSYNIIGKSERQYLKNLPAYIRPVIPGYQDLLLVHGSPESNKEYLLWDTPDDVYINHFEKNQCSILCFGHSHKPFYKKILHADRVHHAVNIGSVGKPKDGDSRGCFVVVSLEESGEVKIEFRRFVYDIEKAVNAIKESSLPAELADRLIGAF